MQPDDTDWKIINILRAADVPNNAIAKELGVSEGTIRLRLKKLKDAGLMEVKALINPEVFENKQLALIAMRVAESRFLEQKAEQVAALDNVLSVSITSGRYDLIAEVLVDSNRGLVHFLTEELPAVEGVLSSETFLMLKSYHKFV